MVPVGQKVRTDIKDGRTHRRRQNYIPPTSSGDNKEVDDPLTARSQAFKAWKVSKCTRASYNTTKHISRRVVHNAGHEADKVVYEGIDHKSSDIFRLANQMRKENVDVVGDKPVKNDTGEMSMSEEAKQNAWAEHDERLLKVEFDWDPDRLSNELPLEDRLSQSLLTW